MNRPWFSPSSKRDLLEILESIAKDKAGAPLQYVERLEAECWMLAENSPSAPSPGCIARFTKLVLRQLRHFLSSGERRHRRRPRASRSKRRRHVIRIVRLPIASVRSAR